MTHFVLRFCFGSLVFFCCCSSVLAMFSHGSGTPLFLGTQESAVVEISKKDDGKPSASSEDKTGDEQDEANAEALEENAEEENADELEEVLAGHSFHGEAFNEGPRQKAYLMGGTGKVDFPVTTTSSEAQDFIHQGVGQLHGFWDLEAERSFRQAASIDPQCAMAYWGAALATVRNLERARGFIAKAVELKEEVSEREQLYIDALDKYLKEKPPQKSKRAAEYIKDLESISLKYPDDLEAKAFIAHRIWQNSREGVAVSSYLAADCLLREIFQEEPLHPAHHYMIHLWDYRHPEKAVDSAARCGISAPSIAHMWHMPGHIYSRLHRYEEAVYQQEASARVDHAHMMRDQVMPDEIHNFAHNNEWLIRNLLFLGRVDDAIGLSKNMISLPRHPDYNTLKKRSGSSSYGRRRLLQLLRQYQLYQETIDFRKTVFLEKTDIEDVQLSCDRWTACAAVMVNDEALENQILDAIQALQNKHQLLVDEADNTIAEFNSLLNQHDDLAERPSVLHHSEDDAKKEKQKAVKTKSSSAAIVKKCKAALDAIEGYRKFRDGDFAGAHELLKQAKDEDSSWLAELQFLAGDEEAAIEEINKVVEDRENEVLPLARQVFILHAAGQQEAAQAAFDQLCQVSSKPDKHLPVFARLQPIADQWGIAADTWPQQRNLKLDVGYRPELDSLGPMEWSPPLAPEWKLLSPGGTMMGSQSFTGKPYIVIFYLGHGCLHCAEQLQAFGPEYEKFKAAGIEMVAISTDGDEGLQRSLENYNGEMPIELLSDENLKVFKQFRAFDDFETLPLHGTFLIDGNQQILWQDISYEPFMDHEFLLVEAQRLLNSGHQTDSQSTLTRRKP